MALVFPSNPSVNDTYQVNGRTYVWNGTSWRTVKGGVPDVVPTLDVDNDFSAGGTLHVDSTNNEIGIGTGTPSHQLHLTQDLGVDGNLIVGGTITVPTPVTGTSDTTAATTAFVADAVSTAVSGLLDGAPAALDTLNELADALDDDASYAATITTALAGKLDTTHDMTLTLSGDATGTATFTNMGNATLSVTVTDDSHNHTISNVDSLQTALDGKLSTTGTAADSSKLGGLSLSAGSSAPSGSQVIRSHTNGYTYLGWLNTVSGATTSTISRIYASNDAFVRYVTPATFRSQVINGQAISPSSVSASGNITASGNLYVGKNGGSDSNAYFYDDNSNTWRTLQWDDSFNNWRVEDNGGTMRTLWHSGNSSGLAVATTTVSASTTYTWYLLNMPSGVNVYNLVSISPVTGVNNILYISEVAWGEWATVQTTSQIRILCRLGNGVHTEPFYINFYYKKDS